MPSDKMRHWEMLCAAIDIGSNTTRVLVAEPEDGQLRKVMEQRAYTRIVKGREEEGRLDRRRQDRGGRRRGRHAGPARAGARRRGDPDRRHRGGPRGGQLRGDRRGDRAAGRLPGRRPQRARRGAAGLHRRHEGPGHPVDGEIGVVDVGGGSSEIILGTLDGGVREVRSFKIGSGSLAEEFIKGDPPGPAEIRKLRDRDRGLLRRRRDRPARAGGRGRRQRHVAAPARRRRARVRDAGTRGSGS